MITFENIRETNRMITENRLDVRTITMGISLRDCAHPNLEKFCQNVYEKITRSAEYLVQTGEDIETEYGIPIINKRISVTPIGIAADACQTDSFVPVAEALDRAGKAVGVNFIGGFSALVEMGDVIKRTAELTREQEALGCAKIVVFCNAPGDNPFMAGAFHGVAEGDRVINVGVSGPGVVKHALEDLKGADFTEIAETIKRTAFKITRVGQLVAREASRRLGVPFGIIDLSLAPTSEVGDSVARILEEMGLGACGAPGTTAALALLNDAVKKGGLMATSHVGGLSGAFIPVSEDEGMIDAVQRGSLSIEKLEAMTCVCSVGLDMIAIEGDTPASTIAGIIADEAAIGMVNNKTTAVRVIPVPGKKVGETVSFGGLLGYSPIVPVRSAFSSAAFIARGGRIPAPTRALTN